MERGEEVWVGADRHPVRDPGPWVSTTRGGRGGGGGLGSCGGEGVPRGGEGVPRGGGGGAL